MAGTTLKAIGAIIMVLGGTLILAGAGGAVVGAIVTNDGLAQGERCFGSDCAGASERVDAGSMLAFIGFVALGVGVVVAILGVVLLFVGVGRARREELRVAASAPREPVS